MNPDSNHAPDQLPIETPDSRIRSNKFLDSCIQSIYEAYLKQFHRSVIVEAGSGWGSHSIPMAILCGHSGQVYCVDPAPSFLQLGLGQYASASLLGNRISYYQKALSDKVGLSEFLYFDINKDPKNFSKCKILLSKDSEKPSLDENEIIVETTTIDHEFANTKNIRLIKLDINFSDFSALMGAEKTIAQNRPLIIADLSKDQSSQRDQRLETLYYFKKFNYRIYSIFGKRIQSMKDIPKQDFPYKVVAIHYRDPSLNRIKRTLRENLIRLKKDD